MSFQVGDLVVHTANPASSKGGQVVGTTYGGRVVVRWYDGSILDHNPVYLTWAPAETLPPAVPPRFTVSPVESLTEGIQNAEEELKKLKKVYAQAKKEKVAREAFEARARAKAEKEAAARLAEKAAQHAAGDALYADATLASSTVMLLQAMGSLHAGNPQTRWDSLRPHQAALQPLAAKHGYKIVTAGEITTVVKL